MIKFLIKKQLVGNKRYVVQIGKNGEPLNTSEMFERWAGAFNNIKAVITGHNPIVNTTFRVIDISNKTKFELSVEHNDNTGKTFLQTHTSKPLTSSELKKYHVQVH